MNLQEYSQKEYTTPYTYILSNKQQSLFYFGVKHFDSIRDTQYLELQSFWKSFLTFSKKNNTLVIVEGGVRKPFLDSSDETALKQGGEMNLVCLWAHKKEILTITAEPAAKEWFKELGKHFPKNAVAYYDFARIVYQWNRKSKKEQPFEEYIAPFLYENTKKSGWKNFDFSIKNMEKIHHELFLTKFNPKDKDFYSSILNPFDETSIINQISRYDDSEIRDKNILKTIKKAWYAGKNIFVIYGASHAVVQEVALRQMVLGS